MGTLRRRRRRRRRKMSSSSIKTIASILLQTLFTGVVAFPVAFVAHAIAMCFLPWEIGRATMREMWWRISLASSSSSSCSSTLRVDIEIACNLLDEISSTTREQVQKRIEALMPQLMVENAMNGAKLNGAACQIGKGYVTNLQPQDFLDAVSRPRTRS